MKKIMILGASILQLPAITKAKDMGIYVIAIDIDPLAIGFDEADEHYVVSTTDIESVLQIAIDCKIDGIMTIATDKPMLTVAKVGEVLGLNTISVETSKKVTNKARMRECLKKDDVPIPKFVVVNNYEQYSQAIEQFSEKFIVKPTDSSGSRGIYLVKNKGHIKLAYEHSMSYSSTGEILVEEYMEGPEVSVESITTSGETNVIAITDKITNGAPNFVEIGHSQPTKLFQTDRLNIINITKLAIKSLGIDNCTTHTEIIVTKEGAKIVEIGARLGGDNIATHLVPLSTGVNMVEACIELSLGIVQKKSIKFKKASAIRYFECPKGTITGIFGKEKIEKYSSIKDIKFMKNVGDSVSTIRSSVDRVGFVITQSNTVDEAMQICEDAIKSIEILVD